jgi:predicted dehydrogenase
MIGGGGMAANWLRRFWPVFRDRAVVTALVDVDEQVLGTAGDALGLPHDRRFISMAAAFETVDADFCTIVIPPAFHEEAVMHAVARRLPILSEKPIADTWDASVRIYRAVRDAGLKMAVIQNYRYDRATLTMRQLLREERLGRLNYLVGRYAQDYRVYGSWGKPFRHEIPHGLLVEGSIHHLDMLRNLAGADCARLAGWEWNPPWSSSKGAFNAAYVLEMTNGVRGLYEGSGTAAGEPNPWHGEGYRAECEDGALTTGRDNVVRIHRISRGRYLTTEEVPLVRPTHEGHLWIIDEFLTWLDGGPRPATAIDDNLQSVAMLFAAIQASETGQVVDVQAVVRSATGTETAPAAAAPASAPFGQPAQSAVAAGT